MTWKPNITENLAQALRFLVRGAILLDGIILALASVYLTLRFSYRAIQYLDATLFSKPWSQ
jgi:hypothetical protein